MRAALQKQVCPYCFETYLLRKTPFRCSSPPSICSPEVDDVYSAAWKEGAAIGRLLSHSGYTRSARCPHCKHETSKRLCPSCHMELSRTTGDCDNLIFAIIGAKAAGKSHYLAVLIEQIRNGVGPALDILLEPVNDRTIKRYREDFYEPIYRRRKVIAATISALADKRVQFPLSYQLSFRDRGLFGRRKIVKTVSLVFFDTAGEDLDSQDVMSTVNKYIYRADGIILLLDPLQLTEVREQLSGVMRTEEMPEQNTETSDIISRMTSLLLTAQKLPPHATLRTPLAVAFSKFDAVQPLIDQQCQLNAIPKHDGGFDAADFAAINGEMQALLGQWNGGRILQQVRTRFPVHGFFGLSALGCNPHGTDAVPRVLPRRVEDPFLWLLHQHGLIKAVGKR